MDAYCLLRFNYLCLRICLFSSFWGMLVLTPVYILEGSEEEGSIYYATLANVSSGSNTLVGREGPQQRFRFLRPFFLLACVYRYTPYVCTCTTFRVF